MKLGLQSLVHFVFTPNHFKQSLQFSAHNGQSVLWRKYKKVLSNKGLKEFRSSHDVTSCLKSLGLQYEEHQIPNSFDITDSFDPDSKTGASFLHLITGGFDIHNSLTPEVRDGILNLLRTESSTEKDGKVFFNHDMTCIIIHAWAKVAWLSLFMECWI